mmetsp:Transcript_8991/g.22859  ORF Transcript_8991/g.22859 Transcript_8991/m.22859 type:complete len:624 (-) Transcript_8991:965-2836(-)
MGESGRDASRDAHACRRQQRLGARRVAEQVAQRAVRHLRAHEAELPAERQGQHLVAKSEQAEHVGVVAFAERAKFSRERLVRLLIVSPVRALDGDLEKVRAHLKESCVNSAKRAAAEDRVAAEALRGDRELCVRHLYANTAGRPLPLPLLLLLLRPPRRGLRHRRRWRQQRRRQICGDRARGEWRRRRRRQSQLRLAELLVRVGKVRVAHRDQQLARVVLGRPHEDHHRVIPQRVVVVVWPKRANGLHRREGEGGRHAQHRSLLLERERHIGGMPRFLLLHCARSCRHLLPRLRYTLRLGHDARLQYPLLLGRGARHFQCRRLPCRRTPYLLPLPLLPRHSRNSVRLGLPSLPLRVRLLCPRRRQLEPHVVLEQLVFRSALRVGLTLRCLRLSRRLGRLHRVRPASQLGRSLSRLSLLDRRLRVGLAPRVYRGLPVRLFFLLALRGPLPLGLRKPGLLRDRGYEGRIPRQALILFVPKCLRRSPPCLKVGRHRRRRCRELGVLRRRLLGEEARKLFIVHEREALERHVAHVLHPPPNVYPAYPAHLLHSAAHPIAAFGQLHEHIRARAKSRPERVLQQRSSSALHLPVGARRCAHHGVDLVEVGQEEVLLSLRKYARPGRCAD